MTDGKNRPKAKLMGYHRPVLQSAGSAKNETEKRDVATFVHIKPLNIAGRLSGKITTYTAPMIELICVRLIE